MMMSFSEVRNNSLSGEDNQILGPMSPQNKELKKKDLLAQPIVTTQKICALL